MDMLLHITGLAFIPIMIYILFLGLRDIIYALRDHFSQQRKEITTNKDTNTPFQLYEFTT